MFQVKLVSALEKVLPTALSLGESQLRLEAAAGELVSFQLAFKTVDLNDLARLSIVGPGVKLAVSKVGLVPAQNPAPAEPDGGYLATAPGLLPDLLLPLVSSEGALETTLKVSHAGWNSVWVDVSAPAGKYQLRLEVGSPYQQGRSCQVGPACQSEAIFQGTVELEVASVPLPTAKIVNTQWFHTDSLANYYGVKVWSEKHWEVIEQQVASAVRMGVNCLLMPLWTPPLDTAVGTYRTTTQLLKIRETAGKYQFDFSRAQRWLSILRRQGITGVEVPHLFTQWGAEATPRFFITQPDGTLMPRFGWDEPATSPDYRAFLTQLLPAVRDFLDAELGEENVWYHLSDEPTAHQLSAYQAAKQQAADLLAGAQIIDALSDPELLEAVDIPVVATDAVERFRALQIEPTWVYNCVAQARKVANRFIAQTGVRHREIGFQLYKSGAQGILHWAFNFYNAQYSLGSIDPFQDTAAGGGFISGDAFVVYPAKDGSVYESIRHRLLRAAMNDLALCQAAEALAGRAAVLAAIDPDGTLDYDAGFATSEQLTAARRRLLALFAN